MASLTGYNSTHGYNQAINYNGLNVPAQFPVLMVELAFPDSPFTPIDDCTWIEVTAFVRQCEIHRGRQHELSEFDAGTVTVILDNRDRRFDPLHLAYTYDDEDMIYDDPEIPYDGVGGPYAPNITPFNRIRVTAIWKADVYRLFTGYVESYEMGYEPSNNDAISIIKGVDAFKILNLFSPLAPFRAEVLNLNPYLYWPLDEAEGEGAVDLSGNDRVGTESNQPSRRIEMDRPVADSGVGTHFNPRSRIYRNDTANFASTQAFSVGFSLHPFIIHDVTQPIICGSYVDDGSTEQYRGWLIDYNEAAHQVRFFLGSDYHGGTNCFSVRNQESLGAEKEFLVMSYDGSGAKEGVTWYVNGVENTGERSLTGTLGTVTSTKAQFIVGSNLNKIPGTVGQPAANQDMSHVFVIDEALDAAQVATLYHAYISPWKTQRTDERVSTILDVVGWPTEERDLGHGVMSMDAITEKLANVLEGMRTVDRTELGATYISKEGKVAFRNRYYQIDSSTLAITFGDSTAAIEVGYSNISPSFDDSDLWNEVHAVKEGSTQIASSTASKDRYAARILQWDGAWESDPMALATAEQLRDAYADPIIRFKQIELPPTPEVFDNVLAREVHEQRVRVIRRPPGGGVKHSRVSVIEGITHSMQASPQKDWRITLDVIPAHSTEQFFRLGTDTLSSTGNNLGF